jgi:aspartyl-tRNA(Asn)/glutamyl-tRNA(Gln) amidotransferase subunit C
MAERLTRAAVERIAALAHLELTRDEAERFTRQLGDILDYAERLRQVDTTGTTASWRPSAAGSALRADTVRPSLGAHEALANAPDTAPGGQDADAGFFCVPRVIG